MSRSSTTLVALLASVAALTTGCDGLIASCDNCYESSTIEQCVGTWNNGLIAADASSNDYDDDMRYPAGIGLVSRRVMVEGGEQCTVEFDLRPENLIWSTGVTDDPEDRAEFGSFWFGPRERTSREYTPNACQRDDGSIVLDAECAADAPAPALPWSPPEGDYRIDYETWQRKDCAARDYGGDEAREENCKRFAPSGSDGD